jgi:hypothetical protein
MGTYYEDGTPEQRAPYDAMVREALALPPSDERRRELARLCRVGAYRPKRQDWPEFGDADWRDGVFYLRGKAQGLAVGQRVCADRENIARVYEIVQLEEKNVEADDFEDTGRMIWKTEIQVSAIDGDGDYNVLPGEDTEDVERRIIWARSNAELKIRAM